MRTEFIVYPKILEEGEVTPKNSLQYRSFYARNTRILTEHIQLMYRIASFRGHNPDDYLDDKMVSIGCISFDSEVANFDLKDEHNKDEFINRNEINIYKINYEETSYCYKVDNIKLVEDIKFDYKEYEEEFGGRNSKVPIKKLQLNFRGVYFKEVKNFKKLDKQVKNLYGLNGSEPFEVVFILTFSNNKTYEVPYRLTKADMPYFSSYGLLKAYSNAMEDCVEIFGEEVKSHMNKVQLDALEMSDYDF